MAVFDTYLKAATESQKKEFERIRKIVHETVPKTEETISYGMPTFNYNKKYLLYVGIFKNHMSLFPGSALSEPMRQKLGKFKLSKGTIRLSEDNPVPESIIKQLLLDRLRTIVQ